MKNSDFGLLGLMQNVDEQMVAEAGQPWEKSNIKRNRLMVKIACALVAVVVAVFIFKEPLQANLGPIKNMIIKHFDNQDKDIISNTLNLQAIKSKNDFELTLNSVLVDVGMINIAGNLEFTKNAKSKPEDYTNLTVHVNHMYIDGKEVNVKSQLYSSQSEAIEREDGTGVDLIPLNHGLVGVNVTYDNIDVTKDVAHVELELAIVDLYNEFEYNEIETFNYTFNAARDQLISEVVEHDFKFDVRTEKGAKIHIDKVLSSTLGGEFIATVDKDLREPLGEGDKLFTPVYYFRIYDNEGNVAYYEIEPVSEDDVNNIRFYLVSGEVDFDNAKTINICLYRSDLYDHNGGDIEEVEPVDKLQIDR